MPSVVRNSKNGRWIKLLLSEPDAVVFASATLNAISKRRDELHDAVFYIKDDEDAERIVALLNEARDRKWAHGGQSN